MRGILLAAAAVAWSGLAAAQEHPPLVPAKDVTVEYHYKSVPTGAPAQEGQSRISTAADGKRMRVEGFVPSGYMIMDRANSRTIMVRGALPAQAVFLVGSERDAYHAGAPANDARFIAVFAHALEHTGGYAPEEARRVAATLLPDMLPYDPTRPAAFPGNGRTLTDDAADAFLAVLTNGKVTGDKVGPHTDLLSEFPYLGPPHAVRVPTQSPSLVPTLDEGERYEPA